MHKIAKLILKSLLLCLFVIIPSQTFALEVFSENFDSYSGDIAGEGGWVKISGNWNYSVVTSTYYSSPNSVAVGSTNKDATYERPFTSHDGDFTLTFRASTANTFLVGIGTSTGKSVCQIGGVSGNLRVYAKNGTVNDQGGNVDGTPWVVFELEYDADTGNCSGTVYEADGTTVRTTAGPVASFTGATGMDVLSMFGQSTGLGLTDKIDNISLDDGVVLSGEYSDYATTTRITSVNNPIDYETETNTNVEFDYDFFFNSALDYGVITYATIELIDLSAGSSLVTATSSIVSSGNTNYSAVYSLVEGHTYQWRPVLGAGRFVRGEWEFFCVGSCQSQYTDGWEPSLGGWTFIEQMNDADEIWESMSTSTKIASSTGIIKNVFDELTNIWPLSLYGDMKEAINGFENAATGTVSSITFDFGGSDSFGVATSVQVSLASVASSHTMIASVRSLLGMAIHIILGLGLLKFISYLWGRGDPRE